MWYKLNLCKDISSHTYYVKIIDTGVSKLYNYLSSSET